MTKKREKGYNTADLSRWLTNNANVPQCGEKALVLTLISTAFMNDDLECIDDDHFELLCDLVGFDVDFIRMLYYDYKSRENKRTVDWQSEITQYYDAMNSKSPQELPE